MKTALNPWFYLVSSGLERSLNWWRRRESNPRPQVIRFRLYMLIRPINLIEGYPVGRENQQRAWISFNGSTPGVLHRGPV